MNIDSRHFKLEMARHKRILKKLSGIEVKRAQAAALNKTAKKVVTNTVRDTAKKSAVKQKLIRPKLKVSKATSKQIEANIKVNTKGIPLIKLNPKQVAGGIQAGQYLVPDGFIATTNSAAKGKGRKTPGRGLVGKTHVFKRKGNGRYPIKMQEVNIRPVITKQAKNAASTSMQLDAAKFLAHEYKFRIQKKIERMK